MRFRSFPPSGVLGLTMLSIRVVLLPYPAIEFTNK